MQRELSETHIPSATEAMRIEIEGLVPEHQLQYLALPWFLEHPELAMGETVILKDSQEIATDWPGYTAVMSNPDHAGPGAELYEDFLQRAIPFAWRKFKKRRVKGAGDEEFFAGPPLTPQATVLLGLGLQLEFMSSLDRFPLLKATIENHKKRHPALIHVGAARAKSPLECLMLKVMRIGQHKMDFACFGKTTEAKLLASTGFVTTTTGRLHVGGSNENAWKTSGPDVILSGGLEETVIAELRAVGLDVKIGPQDQQGESTFATIGVPIGADIESIYEDLKRRVSLPIEERRDIPFYPGGFALRVAKLAREMAPKFQRGETGRAFPDHANNGIIDPSWAIFSFIHWDDLHEHIIAQRDQLFPHAGNDRPLRDTAAMKLIAESASTLVEYASIALETAGVDIKETEFTPRLDAYLIGTYDVEEKRAEPFHQGTLAGIEESGRVISHPEFRRTLENRLAMAADALGEPATRLDLKCLRTILEGINIHTDTGLAQGAAIVKEPIRQEVEGVSRTPGVRGIPLPLASRLGGIPGKQTFKNTLNDLRAKERIEGLVVSESAIKVALSTVAARFGASEDCIVMTRNQAIQLRIDMSKENVVLIPGMKLKGIDKPVDIIALYPHHPRSAAR